MIRAYRLYTGPDGNSHVIRGSVNPAKLVDAQSILFKETSAHSSYDWHNDPIPQYVITLAGVLEFTIVGGETFTLRPGDVLVAEDHTGSGHKWRLINDEPWKRAYVVFKEGADTHFEDSDSMSKASVRSSSYTILQVTSRLGCDSQTSTGFVLSQVVSSVPGYRAWDPRNYHPTQRCPT